MSLFEHVAASLGSQILSQLGGNQQSALMQALAGLLQQPGGLQGLIDRFQQAGLGSQMSSWVGTGSNLPVEGAQLQQALGGDWFAGLASQLGTSPNRHRTRWRACCPS